MSLTRISHLVIIKLGGSLITEKDQPLRISMKGLKASAKALASFEGAKLIVHGAGSFGHYYAKLYGLGTAPSPAPPDAVALTHAAMLSLNAKVVEALSEEGIRIYSFPPALLLEGLKLRNGARGWLERILLAGLAPMTFGDVVPCEGGFAIISGDMLVELLAYSLRPARVTFALDVDGIYPSPQALQRGEGLLTRIDASNPPTIISSRPGMDVTGGLEGKLKVAYRLAEAGFEVVFATPHRQLDFVKALNGEEARCTIVTYGGRRGREWP